MSLILQKFKCSQITNNIRTPDKVKEVANIQELHIAIGHLLCMRTENYFFQIDE